MDIHLEHKNTTPEQANQSCSPEIVRCAFKPAHRYVIEEAGGHGLSVSDCGDSTEIFVNIEDNVVTEASFVTTGCFGQVAAAEKLMEMVTGKTIAEALSITPSEVDSALGHLPPEVAHCTEDSCSTLSKAIQDYLSNRQAPWKRIYG